MEPGEGEKKKAADAGLVFCGWLDGGAGESEMTKLSWLYFFKGKGLKNS